MEKLRQRNPSKIDGSSTLCGAQIRIFTFVKDQYLLKFQSNAGDAISQLDGLDDTQTRRLRYFTDQVIDMMAPTNFLGTNPEALEKAVETQGQSLIDGLENLSLGHGGKRRRIDRTPR